MLRERGVRRGAAIALTYVGVLLVPVAIGSIIVPPVVRGGNELAGDDSDLPTTATEDPWDDVEQGWWGWVKAEGDDVFIAQTDLDALAGIAATPALELVERGSVLVDGVAVTWSRVERSGYDEAWRKAIDACRRGTPRPICEWVARMRGRASVSGSGEDAVP
jgi:hypothetical protein